MLSHSIFLRPFSLFQSSYLCILSARIHAFNIFIHTYLLCCAKLLQSCPTLGVHQAPLSLGFSRQEYWSGLPFPPSGDFPDPGISPGSLKSPVLVGRFFTTSVTWAVPKYEVNGSESILFSFLPLFFFFLIFTYLVVLGLSVTGDLHLHI